jgi:hypothetical protein
MWKWQSPFRGASNNALIGLIKPPAMPVVMTQGDFKRFWKYNLASFIYKIKPPDVLNTMTDEEWYIGVCDNPLEPRVRK